MDNNNETIGTTEELIGNQPIYKAPAEEPGTTSELTSQAPAEQPQQMAEQPQMMGQPQQMYEQAPMVDGKKAKKAKKVKAPKVKKPMTKGKMAGIIIGSVVAAAAVVCGIIFIPRLFSSPKDVVVDAFQNTFGIGAMSDDKFGISEIIETYQEQGGSVSFDATLLNGPIGDDTYSGLSINTNSVTDPQAQVLNTNFELAYNGNNIYNINLIGTADNTYVEVPDMINGYFMIPNDLSQLLNSPLFAGVLNAQEIQLLQNYLSMYTINYFPTYSDGTALNSGYIDAGETLWDNVSVKRKGKEKITVNGKTVKARKYIVSLSEDDFQEFIRDIVKGVVESLKSNATLANSPEYSNVIATLESVDISSMVSGDLSFNVYIKDDKIVKIEADNTLKIMSYLNIGFSGFFDYDEDGIAGDFSVSTMGQTLASITFNTVKTVVGDVDQYVVTGQVSSQGIPLATFEVDANINENANTYEIECSFNAAGQSAGVYLSSSVTDYVKGQSYTYHIDSLKLYTDGMEMFNISSNYNIDVSSNAKPELNDNDKPVYDLTVLTPVAVNQIGQENAALLQEWATNVQSIPGLEGLFEEEEEEVIIEPEIEEPEIPDLIKVELDNYQVIINGTPGYFLYDYSDDEFVQFATENASTLSYSLAETDNPAEYANTFFEGVDDSNLLDSSMNQVVTVEGEDIHYSVITYESLGFKVSSYVFVRVIDDTHVLYAKAYIYIDEDEYEIEDLARALTDEYIVINIF